MNFEEQKQNFINMIEENKYDMGIRKVYADFLDEFGEDSDFDIATKERNWTVEKQKSVDFLEEIVAKLPGEYTSIKNPYTSIESIIEDVKYGSLDQNNYTTPVPFEENKDKIIECVEILLGHKILQEFEFECTC